MKIAYKKKHIQHKLNLSLVWFFVGVFQIILMKDQWWLGLGWLILSITFFFVYLYLKREMYLTITNDYIKSNTPFGKPMKFSDIKEISYFSRDYIILSETDELRINTNYIDETSIEYLKDKL